MSDKTELSKEDQERHVKVSNMYGALDKLIRGMKLYEGKGPLVEKLLQTAYQRLQVAVSEGDLTTKITPVGPMFKGETCIDGSPPKYLFQLFCDGVRELTFREGVSQKELMSLANVFNTDHNKGMDDMVTHLWKQELKGVRYYAVDTLGVQVDAEGEMNLASEQDQQLNSMDSGEEMTLSSSDMRLLKSQNKLNWVRSCKAPSKATGSIGEATGRLTKAIQKEKDFRRFVAIALKVAQGAEAHPMLLNMIQSLIDNGDEKGIAEVLEALVDIGNEGLGEASKLLNASLDVQTLEKLAPIFVEKSPTFIRIFKKAFELESFEPERLVALLKKIPVSDSRQTLQAELAKVGVDLTPFYLESLESEDQEVVISAITSLGDIGSESALEALSKALSNHLTDVRKAAMNAMKGRYDAKAKMPLVKALKDPDKEIRLSALSILEKSGDRMVGSSMLGVMRTPDFYGRGSDEIASFFTALSQFPSPSTLEFLNKLLTEKNLTRSKSIRERQVLAVNTLSNMDSPDAKPALEQCAKRWFLPSEVKNAAKAAAKNK